jgi:hypothetical protein
VRPDSFGASSPNVALNFFLNRECSLRTQRIILLLLLYKNSQNSLVGYFFEKSPNRQYFPNPGLPDGTVSNQKSQFG